MPIHEIKIKCNNCKSENVDLFLSNHQNIIVLNPEKIKEVMSELFEEFREVANLLIKEEIKIQTSVLELPNKLQNVKVTEKAKNV